jgi:hypothetical protein
MHLFRILTLLLSLSPFFIFSAHSQAEKLEHVVALAEAPGLCFFDPPADWELIDPDLLPKSVKILVKAPQSNKYPPCVNLAVDHTPCGLQAYLKGIKELNEADGLWWRDMGMIQTQAGAASLSQVDSESSWGRIRMMHAILEHENRIYILTCAALQEEFQQYYETFFRAMKSMRINPGFFDEVEDKALRADLETRYADMQAALACHCKGDCDDGEPASASRALSDPHFQKEHWTPFLEALEQLADEEQSSWKQHVRQQIERGLRWL